MPGRAACELMKLVKDCEPYVHRIAKSGTIYIRFRDKRLLTVRVADHNSVGTFDPKWNLQKNVEGFNIKRNNGRNQYFCDFDHIELLAAEIKKEFKRMKRFRRLSRER